MEDFEIDREVLVTTFLGESEEVLGRMEQALVTLEARPDDEEVVHALFRDAHTLKGGAATVAFDAVRDLAHELESLLQRVRKRTLAAGAAVITLLLRSVDVLRVAIADAAAGRPSDVAALSALRAAMADVASATSAASGGATLASRTTAGPERTLRVSLAKLDRMLDLSGELAVARGRLTDLLERQGGEAAQALLAAHQDADRLYLDLQELVMAARMVAIGPTFLQHVRTVRDLAAAQGKLARLEVEGADVEVDTAVVEQVRDPITHMVRNAVDHGIEAPAVRQAAGKRPAGTVTLRAFHDGGSMVIEVTDDGAGLDRGRIAQRAGEMGILDPALATPEALARAIFEPGLSTSPVVTDVSGRGVGMDVVRRNVEGLRGSVAVESSPGQGTRVTLRVPLTLAIIPGFRVAVAGQTYVVPLDAVVECVELPADADTSGPAGVLALRGRPLPFLRLRAQFGLDGPAPRRENVVVLRSGATLAGLAVDELLGEASTVVKPLGPAFRHVRGVSGSSILGDGRVALILDVAGLLRAAIGAAVARVAAEPRRDSRGEQA